MRTRALHTAAAIAALLAAPGAAHALDLGGSAGAGYSQVNSSGGSSSNGWNFAGSLSLHGALIDDGGLSVDASGFYGGLSASSDAATSDSRAWGGIANVGAMTSSWHPVTASYARTETDLSSAPMSGPAQTGKVIGSSTGFSAWMTPPNAPRIGAQLARSESWNRDSSGNVFTSGSSNLAVDLAAGTAGVLDYELAWNAASDTGSLAASNFLSHQLEGAFRLTLSDTATASVAATYNLRVPTAVDPSSPRVETDSLVASTSSRLGAKTSNLASYGYAMNLVGVAGQPVRQQTSHGLADSVSYHPDDHWTFVVGGGASSATNRTGDVATNSSGENASLNAAWAGRGGPYQLNASASGSLGALQSQGTESLAWGASAGGSASRPIGDVTTSLSYSVGYARNLGALEQTSFSQVIGGRASWSPGRDLSFSASVTARNMRVDSRLFGTGGSRNSEANLGARWRNVSLFVNAGLMEGLAANLRAGTGDGLFLPLAYNTTQRYFGSMLATAFGPLTFTAFARAVSNEYPDRPHDAEQIAGATARWTVGAWVAGANGYVSRGAAGTSPVSSTTAFSVTLSRGFGASF